MRIKRTKASRSKGIGLWRYQLVSQLFQIRLSEVSAGDIGVVLTF